jgi:hypothetical protein
MTVCNSITSQKSAPKIASPIKSPLPDEAEAENAATTYTRVGTPNPNESKLFHRTVKNFSFVMMSVLFATFYASSCSAFFFFCNVAPIPIPNAMPIAKPAPGLPNVVPMASPTPTPIAIPAPSLSLLDFPFYLLF